MKKKKEATFSLTLKGLIAASIPISIEDAAKVWDAIELHCFRTKKNAILLTDGGVFIRVEKVK